MTTGLDTGVLITGSAAVGLVIGSVVAPLVNSTVASVATSAVDAVATTPAGSQPGPHRVVATVGTAGRSLTGAAGREGRRILVELVTAGLFALLAWRVGWAAQLPAYLYLAALGVALAAIDLATHRLPDALTLPAYPITAALLALASLITGDWGALARAAGGAALLFGAYYLLAAASPGAMGFGDVKLAGVLGMVLAWAGWGQLVTGAFLGFAYGGVISVVLIASGRATRGTRIPFGPFMLLGAVSALILGESLVTGFLGIAPG